MARPARSSQSASTPVRSSQREKVPVQKQEVEDPNKEWEVEAIIGEKGGKYLLKWVDVDPSNGRRYSPTWEPASHAPKDLVKEWKAGEADRKAAPKPKKTLPGAKPKAKTPAARKAPAPIPTKAKKTVARPAKKAAPLEEKRGRGRPKKSEAGAAKAKKASAATKKTTAGRKSRSRS